MGERKSGSGKRRGRPHVIMYNAISADGRVTGFDVDLGVYYGLTAEWDVDTILCGSETIIAAEGSGSEDEDLKVKVGAKPDGLPLFVAVDSRGRVRHWNAIRNAPYFGDVLVLCSESTPHDYIEYLNKAKVRYMIAGKEKVDLAEAVRRLGSEHGAKRIRTDTGGSLNGALLSLGLIDEICLLVHPAMVGGEQTLVYTVKPNTARVDLRLVSCEKMKGGLVLLRYKVK